MHYEDLQTHLHIFILSAIEDAISFVLGYAGVDNERGAPKRLAVHLAMWVSHPGVTVTSPCERVREREISLYSAMK